MEEQKSSSAGTATDGEPDISRSMSRQIVILRLLESMFQALVTLNLAYFHMYPTLEPRQWTPCNHVPPKQGPAETGTAMARQGEQITFIGMLLRSAGKVLKLGCDLGIRVHDHEQNTAAFKKAVRKLKQQHPAVAHGVVVLHCLTAGLCRNDLLTLINLSNLVMALRESGEKCTHDHPDFPGKLTDFYNEASKNCTLTVIAQFLVQHCRECDSEGRVQMCEEKLGKYLKPKNWRGCADCESMLVDILMYNRMFCKTQADDPNVTGMLYKTDIRMMASLKLSLNCVIGNAAHEKYHNRLQCLSKHLCNHGFTEIKRSD